MSDSPENAARPAGAASSPAAPTPAKKPLMRSLGEFVGHIAKGISTDPSKPANGTRQTVRRQVEEEVQDTPQGKVVLRRTTIEEIELRPDSPTRPPSGGA